MPAPESHAALKVSDAMVTEVLAFAPDQGLPDAARALAEAKFSGAPVVRDGKVVGILSEADIMDRLMKEARKSSLVILPSPLSEIGVTAEFIPDANNGLAADLAGLTGLAVVDAMNHEPVVVSPDMEMTEAAQMLIDRRFNRLPVVEAGKLVGLLTRGDVLAKLVEP